MDVEWGGVNIERLPLSRQDSEHCAHHQQGVPENIGIELFKGTVQEKG